MIYDAFISYSHAADGRLAPAVQAGLHRFAKPWYRLRAMHVFRDQTNLSVNPHLWSDIEAALDQSAWFILLASAEAAASRWVDREIGYWLQRRTPDRILIVLTDGAIRWDPAAGAFDPQGSPALPPALLRAFGEEPLYLDLCWARSRNDLSLANPRFRDAVADMAAAVSGRAKDELIGADVEQHRRARELAGAAIAALGTLTVVALLAAWLATVQAGKARREQAIAVEQGAVASARRLAAQSAAIRAQFPDQLPLAALLAVESTRLRAGAEGNQALREALRLLPLRVFADPGDGSDAARVRALSFSPDGQRLAVARDSGVVEVFDAAGGQRVATLQHDAQGGAAEETADGGVRYRAPGFGAEVTAVAFGPDGRRLATGANDGTARLWDAVTGRELRQFRHDAGVATLAIDPHGALLATGGKDGAARLWDLASGRRLFESRDAQEVRAVAFSPDGRLLAALATDGTVSLVDVAARRLRSRWSFGDAGLGLAFSADGSRLATASGEQVAVWDVRTARLVFKATHAIGPGRPDGLAWADSVALSADGHLLASAGRDRTARVWDLAAGQELVRFAHGAPVAAVGFSPDGRRLATASTDGSARLWDLASGVEILRAAHPGGAEVVAFSADGARIASGAIDGAVAVWTSAQGGAHARMAHDARVGVVAVANDGSALASTAGDAVRVWTPDGAPGSAPARLQVPRIERLAFSDPPTHLAALWSGQLFLLDRDPAAARAPLRLTGRGDSGPAAIGARFLAAADRARGTIRIWRSAGGAELPPLPIGDPVALAFDPGGEFLAVARRATGDDGGGAFEVWSLAPPRLLGRIAAPPLAGFALGPRGRQLAVARSIRSPTASDVVDLYDVATGQRQARIAAARDARIAFDPYDDQLAIVAQDQVALFDLPGGALRARLAAGGDIAQLRWSDDRRALATLGGGVVRIWSVATGEPLLELSDSAPFTDLRFAAGGRYLFTAGPDRDAVLWLWRTEDLQQAACERVGRNLDPVEWQRYFGAEPYRKTCPSR